MSLKKIFFAFILFSLAGCASYRGPASTSADADSSAASSSEEFEDQDALESAEFDVQTKLDEVNTQSAESLMSNTVGLSWPVRKGRITQHYDSAKRKPHLGVDISAPRGSEILSAHDGQVIYVCNRFKGYGKMLIIEYGDRWATLYSHLSKISVREGQVVKRGQAVGLIGRTGNATGIHLHFEIRYFRQPIDPLRFLPQGPSQIAYFQ